MNNLAFCFYHSTSSFTLSKACNFLIFKYLYFLGFVPLFGKMEQKQGGKNEIFFTFFRLSFAFFRLQFGLFWMSKGEFGEMSILIK